MPGANTALSALAVLGVLSAGFRLVFAPGIKRLVVLTQYGSCSFVLNMISGSPQPHIIS